MNRLSSNHTSAGKRGSFPANDKLRFKDPQNYISKSSLERKACAAAARQVTSPCETSSFVTSIHVKQSVFILLPFHCKEEIKQAFITQEEQEQPRGAMASWAKLDCL